MTTLSMCAKIYDKKELVGYFVMNEEVTKLYPTDEDLFKSFPSTVPVVTFREETASSEPNAKAIGKEIFNEGEYLDGQIIPWGKLDKLRQNENLHRVESSSSVLDRFVNRYNQWPIIILASVTLSLLAIFLDWSSTWLNDIKYGYCSTDVFKVRSACEPSSWKLYGGNHRGMAKSFADLVIVLICTVVLSFLGLMISSANSWLVKSGISELMAIIAGAVNNDFLNWSIILKKYVSLIFIVACGGLLLGYEGPLIHISCGVINFFLNFLSGQFHIFNNLNNEVVRREFLSIGFVIGISLAFGAPIGGLLFSLEKLKLGKRFHMLMWNGFVCSTIATFIFFKVHPFKKITINKAFTVDLANGYVLLELIPYLFVGLICGFLSLAFNSLQLRLTEFRKSSKCFSDSKAIQFLLDHPIAEITLLATITTTILYPLKFSDLTMNDLLVTLFHDCTDPNKSNNNSQSVCTAKHETLELIYYLVVIFIQSNLAYTLDIPGGILLPSLVIGGLIGRIIGRIVELFQIHLGSDIFAQCFQEKRNCVSPGSYAIVGAASFFAGVTNTSVAAVVIVFEITGAVTYLIPLMMGVVVAKSIVELFDSRGFYEMWLSKTHKNYLAPETVESLKLSPFSDVAISGALKESKNRIVYYDELIQIKEFIKKLDQIIEDNNFEKELINNDGFVVLQSVHNRSLVGFVDYASIDRLVRLNGHSDSTLISFSSPESEVNNTAVLNLSRYMKSRKELFIVNSRYPLLSTYDLMEKMLVTNLFVCEDTTDGEKFRGVLRISDLTDYIRG